MVTKRNASRDDAGTFVQQAPAESVQSVTPVHTAHLALACLRCKEIPMLLAHQVRNNAPIIWCSSHLVPKLWLKRGVNTKFSITQVYQDLCAYLTKNAAQQRRV